MSKYIYVYVHIYICTLVDDVFETIESLIAFPEEDKLELSKIPNFYSTYLGFF